MQNHKINIDRKKVSSDEIQSHRNFNAVLSGAKKVSKPFYKNPVYINGFAIVVLISVVLIYLSQPKSPVQEQAYIHPAIAGVDIAFESYIINADSAALIQCTSGTTIQMEANSFVDADGNLITGQVDIQCREFRNPADIFLAGIPMQYDSAGVTNQFESAGMIEVKGLQNGKPIFIKENKALQVNLASNDADSNYNLYELSVEEKNWKYKGKDSLIVPAQDDNTLETSQKEDEEKDKELEESLAQQYLQRKQLEKTKPLEPQKASDNDWTFNIQASLDEFPELAAYQNVLWQVDASKYKMDASNSNVEWEDVSIKRVAKANKYLISFIKGDKKLEYEVIPVFEGVDYENALRVYNSKYLKYQKKLNERKEEEQRIQALIKKRQEEIARRNKAIEEQSKNIVAYNQAMESKANVFRSFQMTGFGIYNCDRIISQKKFREKVFSMGDESGASIKLTSAFMVVENVNALIEIYPTINDKEKWLYNVKYLAGSKNMIWGITSDNKLAVLSYDEFQSQVIEKEKHSKLTLKIINAKITSPRSFKKLVDNNFR